MTLKSPRLWAVAAAFVAAPAFAQNIAVVNGTAIPKSRADAMVAQMVQQGQPDSPALEKGVREELISREILMQDALQRGIANRPDVKAQIAIADQTIVLRALVEDFVKRNQPSDAEVKAKYDEIVKSVPPGSQVHLHHILVPDEQQAKDLIAKIKAGAKFEDLAKQYSKDSGSAQNGGDLGWADPSSFVPEFAAAAEKLQKGQMTDTPVQTQYGWHVIRFDDSRAVPPPAFDKVKGQLAQQMLQQKLQVYEEGLRAKAKIQ
ncbi:peptidylprolyl isomerase [Burkholderia guangdongensis]|uniref:peptidylprolyl isomerase n=1 Tax=Burkholderia guangdongensis TaxID=1792500 RepID=UPI0015C8E65B|nr:peptidylprolyl isomerase [Burkholderia guangdongensis]